MFWGQGTDLRAFLTLTFCRKEGSLSLSGPLYSVSEAQSVVDVVAKRKILV